MSDRFETLITELVEELEPVRQPLSVIPAALLWLGLSAAYVIALALLLGPFRPGFADQLLQTPVFATEMAAGVGAVFALSFALVQQATPGMSDRLVLRFAVVLLILWLGHFLVGFIAPVLEPSMLGKRATCALEAYALSLPPLSLAVWLQRRRFVLRPIRATLSAALAAAMIPAVLMQVACMYEPTHILLHHVLPVGVVSTGAVAAAWLWERRRRRN
jgi:hypothetical protein